MPIVVNLDLMLARRKLNLTQLSKLVDLTLTNLSILKCGRAKAIRFTTLDDLCRVLKCQPGDLLEYMTDEAYNNLFDKGIIDNGQLAMDN